MLLTESLGEEAVSAALRELYLLHAAEDRKVTEEEIYDALLMNTPPNLKEEFLSIYRELRTPEAVAGNG